jgi:large subunit ribosomal protein L21e
VPITKFLQNFSIGEKVVIVPEPSSQKGLPFRRFKGKVGTVIERRGRSYVVQITDGGKVKKIISRPEHLQKV